MKNLTTKKRSNSRNEQALVRDVFSKKPLNKILIVCEGRNTEPSYFSKFKIRSLTIIPINHKTNPDKIIARAIMESGYTTKWCVFDKDSTSDHNFNKAIQQAISKGINVAYSNQAFEYWLILHLIDDQGGKLDRGDYVKIINRELQKINSNVKYDPVKKIVSDEFFQILEEREKKAIKRAARNFNMHKFLTPAKAESSTKVFSLVEDLRKELKKTIT